MKLFFKLKTKAAFRSGLNCHIFNNVAKNF